MEGQIMHSTQGDSFDPDLYDDGSNIRGFRPANPPAILATKYAFSSANAVQEEISNIMRLNGIALAPDAATDKSNGWRQMYDTIFQSKKLTKNAIENDSLDFSLIPQTALENPLLKTGLDTLALVVNTSQFEVNLPNLTIKPAGIGSNEIAQSSVTKSKLNDDAKIFYVSETYPNLSYSGGGGGAAKVPEFTRSVTIGQWYRVKLFIQELTDNYSLNFYDGLADDGPNPGSAVLIPGGRMIVQDPVAANTRYVEVLYKATQNQFSITSGSSGSWSEAVLAIETAVVRDDSPA